MSLLQTMLVGIGGSFIAGLIFYVISGGQARGVGFLAAFTCSVGDPIQRSAADTDSARYCP